MIAAAPLGHVKLARKMFDAEFGDDFWLEAREFSRFEAWVYMIQMAAFRRRQYSTTKYGVITLKRGEFLASRRQLAKTFGWTEMVVRGFLTACEKSCRIATRQLTHAGTVYLIVNYDTYQSTPAEINPPINQPVTQQQPKREAGKASKTKKSIVLGPDAERVLQRYRVLHPLRRPSEKDATLVVRALGWGYTPDELCAAVEGNARDEWARKIRKHGLSWTLRDHEHIDDNIALSGSPHEPITDEWGVLTARGLRLTAP